MFKAQKIISEQATASRVESACGRVKIMNVGTPAAARPASRASIQVPCHGARAREKTSSPHRMARKNLLALAIGPDTAESFLVVIASPAVATVRIYRLADVAV